VEFDGVTPTGADGGNHFTNDGKVLTSEGVNGRGVVFAIRKHQSTAEVSSAAELAGQSSAAVITREDHIRRSVDEPHVVPVYEYLQKMSPLQALLAFAICQALVLMYILKSSSSESEGQP